MEKPVKKRFTPSIEENSGVKHLIKVFLCSVIGNFIFLPSLIIPGILIVIYRLIVTLIYKFVYDDKYSLAEATDAIFSLEKHANAITINSFMYIKGTANIYKFREKVKNKLINYEDQAGHRPFQKLTKKLIRKFGMFTWEETSDEFDICEHVKFCPGADSPSRTYTEQDVLEANGQLADNLFTSQRPQWEFLIVPKVKLGESEDLHYSIIFRVHHAYMDGVSLLQIIQKGIIDESDEKLAVSKMISNVKPSLFEIMIYYAQVLVMWPCTLFDLWILKSHNIFQNMTENKGPKYFGCTTLEMSLESVKSIRKVFNCSTTAVFNSMISGALRKAAERKGFEVPETVDFGFTVAMLPYPDEKLQNRFTIGVIKSPVGISDSRIRLVKMDSMIKSYAHHNFTTLYWLGKVVGLLPVFFIEMIFEGVRSAYVMSNLPGFEDKLYVDKCSVEEMYGCPPIRNGVGYGVGISSYLGKIRACWQVEHTSVISSREDLQALIADFENEFKIFKKAAAEMLNNN